MIASWCRVVNEPAPSQPALYNQALRRLLHKEINTSWRTNLSFCNFSISLVGAECAKRNVQVQKLSLFFEFLLVFRQLASWLPLAKGYEIILPLQNQVFGMIKRPCSENGKFIFSVYLYSSGARWDTRLSSVTFTHTRRKRETGRQSSH